MVRPLREENKERVYYFDKGENRRKQIANWVKEDFPRFERIEIKREIIAGNPDIAYDKFKDTFNEMKDTEVYYIVIHNIHKFGEAVLLNLFKNMMNTRYSTKKIEPGENIPKPEEAIKEEEKRHYGYNAQNERELADLFFRIDKDGNTTKLLRSKKTGRWLKVEKD